MTNQIGISMQQQLARDLTIDMAIVDMCGTVAALWSARDANPQSLPLEVVLGHQETADGYLRQWAHREGMPHATAEELADVLAEIRQRNTDRLMAGFTP